MTSIRKAVHRKKMSIYLQPTALQQCNRYLLQMNRPKSLPQSVLGDDMGKNTLHQPEKGSIQTEMAIWSIS